MEKVFVGLSSVPQSSALATGQAGGGKKVFVGLSGGVDSAVAAALLKEEGYEVVGCFIKIWQPEFIECTWREDRLDAMRVAAKLGVPFREIDLSEAYEKEVVEKMIAGYGRGITPNPDVLCNSSIKFGHFLRWALEEGAEKVATGHYVRLAGSGEGIRLLRGKDADKDQSYFLWQLGKKELEKSIFPVGGLAKWEVRSLARRYDLPNAEKPDSQGLCFVGDVSMEDFLKRFLPLSPGPVLSVEGAVIGEHHGAALYTLGQRHGFSVRSGEHPHYVVAIDVESNTVVASEDRTEALRSSVQVSDLHWIREPSFPLEAEVEARYREMPVSARITEENREMVVEFAEPHLVSPGQSLVVYQGEECLGGGTIIGEKPEKK